MAFLVKQLRFFNQIPQPVAPSSFYYPSSIFLNIRRLIHVPPYSKNMEEEALPRIVLEDMIKPESDKYWAPNPETGVFGPDTKIDPTTFHAPSNGHGSKDSVLEQQAFFRPLEDLEIPEEQLEQPIEP